MTDTMVSPMLPPLLTREQAADYLGIKVITLDTWRRAGTFNLPFVRVGQKIRYRAQDLSAFLESRAEYPGRKQK